MRPAAGAAPLVAWLQGFAVPTLPQHSVVPNVEFSLSSLYGSQQLLGLVATSSTLRIRRSSAVMQLSSNSLIGIETGEQNIQHGMGELFGPLWACLNHAFAMWQRQTWGLENKKNTEQSSVAWRLAKYLRCRFSS